MCLAVPMQITKIDGFQCTCEARGIEHILVHVGYAIQKVSKEEAAQSWELFDEILAAEV